MDNFPKHGVKLAFFAEFIDEVCGGRHNLIDVTTSDVCERYVRPATDDKSSYCDLLKLQIHPAYGAVATVFISHAWKYKFLDVVDALLYHFRDAPETIVWFDLFTNNQHMSAHMNFDWWSTTFKSAIAEFGHTVMVMSPWNDPIPLTRAWCLWEVYCTAATNSQFELAMTQSATEQFYHDVSQNPKQELDKMLATIDVRRSECSKPEDQVLILDAVNASIGCADLNALVFERLRCWVMKSLNQKLDQGDFSSLNEELSFVNALASVYYGQGLYPEAEMLYKECVERSKAEFGNKHPFTLSSINNLALFYEQLGRFNEAEPLLVECQEISKEVLGKSHPDTITSMNNLAVLYQYQGNYTAAGICLNECLKSSREALGDSHPDTITSVNNLALLFQANGDYSDAEPLLVSCLNMRRELLGDNHPDTLVSMNNLATLFQKEGKM